MKRKIKLFVFISVCCMVQYLSAQSVTSYNSARTALSASTSTGKTKSDKAENKTQQKTEDTNSFIKENSLLENSVNSVLIANSSKDYPVTPGDVYQLAYAVGTTAVTYQIPVDSTYSIKIANLAVINGEGKTFLQLKKQVEDIVSRNYPMGGVQFVIYQTAVFQVTIKGEVVETQTKKVSALTRLSSVLEFGTTEFASERNITVISEKGEKKNYDLYKAKRNGDLSQNPYLRPGDEIIVNHYERRVSIYGAVERPGEYELLENENLRELINEYGGGLLDRADTSRIEVNRTADVLDRSGRKIYLSSKAIADDYVLMNYDSVFISDYNEMKTVVFFEGAVNASVEETNNSADLVTSNKIAMQFEKDENYAFLIRKYKDVFLPNADLKSGYIRRNADIIPIDLEQILYNPEIYSEEVVQEFDTLIVPFKQYFVSVAGAVENPGRYPYIPDRTWEYYIGLAGGFNKEKNTADSIEIVDKNNKKCSEDEYILPEYTITAKTNSFTYYFNKYAPLVTTVLSAVSTIVTIVIATK